VTLGAEGALLSAAVVGLFLSAPVALAHRRGGYAVALGASILLLVAAILELAFGRIEGLAWTGPLGDPEGIGLDGLSAFFALAASVVWIATSSYSIFYDDRGSTLLAFCYGLTLAAIALLVSASSFLLFLIGWEVMTLASYGMILQARGRTDRVFSAAFVFLAFGEGSTLLVVIAVAALRAGSGTFELGETGLGGTLASLAFVTALLGFGLKMGVAPFHLSEWLPIAHSSAPSNASAVLSSTLTLAGAYGLFRVVSSLGPPEVWWGGLTLAIGAISVLLGALFASVSEHTKGLPAYSTIENNGLVLVALGTALVAESYGLTELAVFALFAAFYQAIAHAVAKTALFLSAGYVEHAAHTFDLTGVAGAVKGSDPGESSGTLVAALSLAAAPPLAGFVSEWMVLEALFQSYRFSTPAPRSRSRRDSSRSQWSSSSASLSCGSRGTVPRRPGPPAWGRWSGSSGPSSSASESEPLGFSARSPPASRRSRATQWESPLGRSSPFRADGRSCPAHRSGSCLRRWCRSGWPPGPSWPSATTPSAGRAEFGASLPGWRAPRARAPVRRTPRSVTVPGSGSCSGRSCARERSAPRSARSRRRASLPPSRTTSTSRCSTCSSYSTTISSPPPRRSPRR